MIKKIFFALGIIFLFSFVSSVTLNQGIVLNTTSSNSSINFSFSINVTNFTIEENYILLNGINYPNLTGSYNCSDLNYSISNSVIDVSEFNCSIVVVVVPDVPEEEMVYTRGGSSLIIKEKEMVVGYTRTFRKGTIFWIDVKKERHKVKLGQIQDDKIFIQIFSEVNEKWMGAQEEWFIELNHDGFYDLYVKVNSFSGNYINLTIKEIYSEIETPKQIIDEGNDVENILDAESNETEIFEKEAPSDRKKSGIVLIIVILAVLIFISILKNRKGRKNNLKYKEKRRKIKIKKEISKNNRKKVLKRLNKTYKKNSS